MSAEILVVRRSSAFVKTTARQVDRRYNKFKRLLLASGRISERAVTQPRVFPNATPPPSRARARDLSYTVGSHKLTCVVHTALVRSLVVFATRDDGQRIVVTSILSQFQRAGLRASGTQVYDLCSIRATPMRANLRAARRNYSCRTK
jgi:hypothetical protein